MNKKLFKRVMLLFLMIFIVPNSVKAITFSITKSADNIKAGATSTIIINAKIDNNESDSLAAYSLTLKFDNSRLEWAGGESSNESSISVSGNTVTINSNAFTENKSSDFEVGRFNLKVAGSAPSGNAALTLGGTCDLNDVGSGGTCQMNSSQITVAALGTDSSLSSLEIPNTTLSPAFSKGHTEYTAKIQDITSLSISAVPSDKNAKVSISDNAKSLQKGENTINVNVTSEDGQNKTTYTLKVTLSLTPTDEEKLKANALLKSLIVKEEKIDFDQNEKKYYVTVPYDKTKLTVTAKPVNDKAKVTIEGNKKLNVGKNTVKITVISEDKSTTETYQIIVTRKDEEKEIVQTCPDETSSREWILFSVCMLVTFTLGIILGYYLCKKDVLKKLFTKKEKVQEEPVEVETLSDTIDLSDTVKEVKKKKNK